MGGEELVSTATRKDLSNDWEKALKALALLDEKLGVWISSKRDDNTERYKEKGRMQ